MKVIDFEPQFWFLLQQGNDYFIDVNCNYSFVGYGRFIKLNEAEVKNYTEKGKLFITELANDIQYFGMDKKYAERHIQGETNDLAYLKIMEFNSKNKHR